MQNSLSENSEILPLTLHIQKQNIGLWVWVKFILTLCRFKWMSSINMWVVVFYSNGKKLPKTNKQKSKGEKQHANSWDLKVLWCHLTIRSEARVVNEMANWKNSLHGDGDLYMDGEALETPSRQQTSHESSKLESDISNLWFSKTTGLEDNRTMKGTGI